MNVRNMGKEKNMIKLVVINSEMELYLCDLVGFGQVKGERLREETKGVKVAIINLQDKTARTDLVQSYTVSITESYD